ncbi:MAG: exodeoxyribonuclease III [Nanoarchaeota archaeon]|nr:exodeoxyribonuclease III [Nanoarchaeota archaeon]
MKLISWNVNGIRACIKNGFLEFLTKEAPDILCLQETKANPDQVSLHLPGYYMYWNSAEKKGYSGTAVFTKIKPLFVQNDMGIIEHDNEGRIIAVEYKDYYLVNVYAPNAKRDLARLEYKVRWNKDFLMFVKELEKKKPVIFCGDMNVAHREIDLKNPKANEKNAGFTIKERSGFSEMLESGFVDTYRHFYPNKTDAYTWWSYMFHAREKNIGWRIDNFVVSEAMIEKVKDAFILDKVMGSDHCPVGIFLK